MTTIDATYSPDDNKIRLYPSARLDADTFARVKSAGFKWAPRQELFVAPKWTPDREDLARELAGDIGDDDTSLTERAEERADRFSDYSTKRAADAKRAADSVHAIGARFEFGQPILVGHHSEKSARRDKEKMDNGMRRAVDAWATSTYWTERAAGAVRNAKYKERADVRARRIKGIEADLRRVQKSAEMARASIAVWSRPLTIEQARIFAGVEHITVARSDDGRFRWSAYDVLRADDDRYSSCPAMTVAEVSALIIACNERTIACCARWSTHYENRLAYERAMLSESGYVEPPKRLTRAVLPLLNYAGTVSVQNRYGRGVDTSETHAMTKAEYARIGSDYKGTRLSADGTHRLRTALLHHPTRLVMVFLSDQKAHAQPGSESADAGDVAKRIQVAREKIEADSAAYAAAKANNDAVIAAARVATHPPLAPKPEAPADVDAMRATLRSGGVQTVVAPQLFPTPPEIAARLVNLAGIRSGMRVLEPSAGTGNILRAIADSPLIAERGAAGSVTAIEINARLGGAIPANLAGTVIVGDFMKCNAENLWGTFDRIIMNPPFVDAQDVAHIRHALTLLSPGGRLVAICANGPRQNAVLMPLVDACGGEWIDLEPGAFATSGTNVRTAILVFHN